MISWEPLVLHCPFAEIHCSSLHLLASSPEFSGPKNTFSRENLLILRFPQFPTLLSSPHFGTDIMMPTAPLLHARKAEGGSHSSGTAPVHAARASRSVKGCLWRLGWT